MQVYPMYKAFIESNLTPYQSLCQDPLQRRKKNKVYKEEQISKMGCNWAIAS
ncbi:hypothetical protein HanRHA438_Chr14g0634811 [Helianthus annuus]|nr:hypothetical protein HanHA300_Chr14g0510491 [Helianthus annuus]KAJ0484378.1 hypothetical protein HanHA89_Chr14g0543451 [Helianthus annuus]KAJ0654930.1 hypothetical protein HanLR1_Chr14g0512711 [Helianthus annuus]KAJ0658657.1 hypothetical protein HanOQP8_Chr14g0510691 [Helianthus annuus]KAJ0852144.1 hypothetical protein HanRHA438_Chr14g0634811 [Helianthus annuus]